MPETLKDLRRRIKSVRNTEQITQAMRLVSTAKFGRAQGAVVQARPYSQGLRSVLVRTLEAAGLEFDHPLLGADPSRRVFLFVISSDRGLCGGYNAGMVRLALQTYEEMRRAGKDVCITCIGRKAHQVLVRRLRPLGLDSDVVSLESLAENPSQLADPRKVRLVGTQMEKQQQGLARILATALGQLGTAGLLGQVSIVHTRFVSAGQMPQAVTPLLPLPKPDKPQPDVRATLFEPTLESVLGTVIPRFLEGQLRQVFVEAIAAEYGARMTAMESATRNAKEMLKKLQIRYQRARQAAITKELIEIVSGAEAL